MSLTRFTAMYGKLEGAEGKFARDVTGYVGIEAGIYSRFGLDLSWQHVQGTEERYRRLDTGAADISFVVGRAALNHFLESKTTRLIGSSLNSCPYHLIVIPPVKMLRDLKGKTLACREEPARSAALVRVFEQNAGLKLDGDVALKLVPGDQDAFAALLGDRAQAALLPRQYGFLAEEKGFKRMNNWPDIVDDPLPVAIETTEKILRDRSGELAAFIAAHREAIRHLKANRDQTVRMLADKFGHSPSLAAKTFDEYLLLLDDRLTIDLKHVENLLAQVAPDYPGGALKLAAEWIAPGVLAHSS
jgi:ABC-type nitrate/sulfonate/bicarbonate transport system substrate-binding protein